MKRLCALAALAMLCAPAHAQQNRPTLNQSVTIATGGTWQTILPAGPRWSVTIQNNNTTTDNCWLFIGSGTPSTNTAILLTPGLPYQRDYPNLPSDAFQATCANAGDSLYIDTQ